MSLPKMPARLKEDGAVQVSRLDGDFIALDATYAGKTESLVVSEYNAWRLFGLLSVMLKLPLSKAVSKSIKMGGYGPGSITFVPTKPLETLGDKLAWKLAAKMTVEHMREQGHECSLAGEEDEDA